MILVLMIPSSLMIFILSTYSIAHLDLMSFTLHYFGLHPHALHDLGLSTPPVIFDVFFSMSYPLRSLLTFILRDLDLSSSSFNTLSCYSTIFMNFANLLISLHYLFCYSPHLMILIRLSPSSLNLVCYAKLFMTKSTYMVFVPIPPFSFILMYPSPQSNELTKGPPELVRHFCL